jgi:hypothetical protein
LTEAGIRHGTTTRGLGDMSDPARRRAFFAGLGLSDEPGLCLKQVHGTRVVRWPEEGESASGGPHHADGWVAAEPGRPVCVYTSDCVPLTLWDSRRRCGGVFHAGWRGAAAGMPGAAVASLAKAFGSRPSDIAASVGPHIRPCCFRVGTEVSAAFRHESVVLRGGEVFVDLGAETAAQLAEAGLDRAAVSVCPECTCCRPDLFHSYRRDGTRESLLSFLIPT